MRGVTGIREGGSREIESGTKTAVSVNAIEVMKGGTRNANEIGSARKTETGIRVIVIGRQIATEPTALIGPSVARMDDAAGAIPILLSTAHQIGAIGPLDAMLGHALTSDVRRNALDPRRLLSKAHPGLKTAKTTRQTSVAPIKAQSAGRAAVAGADVAATVSERGGEIVAAIGRADDVELLLSL